MTKRILSVALAVMMLMSLMTFTASASDIEYFVDMSLPQYTYTITDVTGSGYIDGNPEYGMEVYITTDSVITFNFPLDGFDIWDMEEQETIFAPGFWDEADAVSSWKVSAIASKEVRLDNPNVDSLEKGDYEVHYYAPGAKFKFETTGHYTIFASVGFENADERIKFYTENEEIAYRLGGKDGHISFAFDVYVEIGENWMIDDEFDTGYEGADGIIDPTPGEEYTNEDAYNTSLVSIEGIKDIYHQSEYNIATTDEEYTVFCTSPLVITAKTALDDFAVYPMYFINDGHQLWDEKEPIYPDGKKAQDYDWYESHQKIQAERPDADLIEYVYAEAGEKYTITKPGIYHLYATIYDEEGNYENDIRSSLILKVTDLNAKYTDSKVLVDGEEYKFEAYNIEDNNYFKLRDIAMMLNKNDIQHQFVNVTWDAEKEVVNIKRGEKYQAVGGEFTEGDGMSKVAEYGATELYIDGYPTPVRAYMINGNNYFKLRELAELFGTFEVGWDEAANCVIIDTLSILNQ